MPVIRSHGVGLQAESGLCHLFSVFLIGHGLVYRTGFSPAQSGRRVIEVSGIQGHGAGFGRHPHDAFLCFSLCLSLCFRLRPGFFRFRLFLFSLCQQFCGCLCRQFFRFCIRFCIRFCLRSCLRYSLRPGFFRENRFRTGFCLIFCFLFRTGFCPVFRLFLSGLLRRFGLRVCLGFSFRLAVSFRLRLLLPILPGLFCLLCFCLLLSALQSCPGFFLTARLLCLQKQIFFRHLKGELSSLKRCKLLSVFICQAGSSRLPLSCEKNSYGRARAAEQDCAAVFFPQRFAGGSGIIIIPAL